MEFKGTPAPWKLAPMGPNGCPIVGGGITMVAMLAHSVNESDQGNEARANAHLIAAAPELLEALIDIQQSLSKYIEIANNIGVEVTADGFYLGHAIDAEEKARQAIAKALGEEK